MCKLEGGQLWVQEHFPNFHCFVVYLGDDSWCRISPPLQSIGSIAFGDARGKSVFSKKEMLVTFAERRYTLKGQYYDLFWKTEGQAMSDKTNKDPYLPIRLIPTQYCVHREDLEKLHAEGWEWDERGQMFFRACGLVQQGVTAWRAFQNGGLPGPSLEEIQNAQSNKYKLTAKKTDAESVKVPPVKTLCVKCRYEYVTCDETRVDARNFYLCQCPATGLPQHIDPVTGHEVYGQECRMLSWPPCKTINNGNCPHFQAKP